MTRVEIIENVHKKVKRYALDKDLSVPDAYAELIESGLKWQADQKRVDDFEKEEKDEN